LHLGNNCESRPDYSASARIRAFDELPKRTKSLGDSTAAWVKSLARRCAMGHFLNAEIVEHCILLAQECFREGEIPESAEFLACVKTAVDVYPSLGTGKEGFQTLQELFTECRTTSGKMKKVLEEYNMVTTLSAILADVAPAKVANLKRSKVSCDASLDWRIESFFAAAILTHCFVLLAILGICVGRDQFRPSN
jgi:hypothetical protein